MYILFKKKLGLKGGYLDFSHLTELKHIYITEIHKKKKNTNQLIRIIKLKETIFDGVPSKDYVAS